MTSYTLPQLAAAEPLSRAGEGQLVIAALVGIAVVVLLITAAKFHPFLALILGTATLGVVAQVPPGDIIDSFTKGFGATVGSVGLLIALGAMIGKLLADSGGADEIVDTIIGRVGDRGLPWAMALIAAILGLPLFFEVGVVLLVPVVILVARRTHNPLMRVGIPALAGLSILHGLVPPHPGPLVAIDALKADLGYTLLLGLVVAAPTLVISGPLLARLMVRWVPKTADDLPDVLATSTPAQAQPPTQPHGGAQNAVGPQAPQPQPQPQTPTQTQTQTQHHDLASTSQGLGKRPSFLAALISIVLPVILMLARAVGELTLAEETPLRNALDFIGTPVIALLAAVLVAMWALGRGAGMKREHIHTSLGSGLPGVAAILLIVAAGGGFKQMLVDSGVANVIGESAKGANLSPLLLGWLVAVGIRLATGSATVATITAAGIVSPLAADLDKPHLSLLVLAVGAGSLFFSHVNDAGFWLVKEYFGLTVWETIKSWSVMETVISVVALVFVLLLGLVV